MQIQIDQKKRKQIFVFYFNKIKKVFIYLPKQKRKSRKHSLKFWCPKHIHILVHYYYKIAIAKGVDSASLVLMEEKKYKTNTNLKKKSIHFFFLSVFTASFCCPSSLAFW